MLHYDAGFFCTAVGKDHDLSVQAPGHGQSSSGICKAGDLPDNADPHFKSEKTEG